ncbi:MAG: hypothetical protein WDA16_05205 [Candidatus Thermoplasmatota archaeon]
MQPLLNGGAVVPQVRETSVNIRNGGPLDTHRQIVDRAGANGRDALAAALLDDGMGRQVPVGLLEERTIHERDLTIDHHGLGVLKFGAKGKRPNLDARALVEETRSPIVAQQVHGFAFC